MLELCLVPFDSCSLGLRPTDHSLRTTIQLVLVVPFDSQLVWPAASRLLAQALRLTDVSGPR
jgi:hypothetical protein